MSPTRVFCALVCFLAFTFIPIQSEIYTSLLMIQKAWNLERQTLDEAKDYLEFVDYAEIGYPLVEELYRFKRFVNETLELHLKWDGDEAIAAYLRHPTHVYHFVKRCVEDWRLKTHHFWHLAELHTDTTEYWGELDVMFNENRLWPRPEDLVGVSLGFLRIEQAYPMNFTELGNGTLHGISAEPLTIRDMYDIAMVGYERWFPKSAVLWLNNIEKRMGNEVFGAADSGITFKGIKEKKADIYFRHGDYKMAMEELNTLIELNPENFYLRRMMFNYQEKSRIWASIPLRDQHRVSNDYYSLCRGDAVEGKRKNDLYCFLKPSSIPYRPSKIEILNKDLDIYMFHDVIYESELKFIKKLAKERMTRSEMESNPDYINTGDYRVSGTAWLGVDDEVRNIVERVHSHTGLNIVNKKDFEAIEDLQVVNYGIGGLYGPHFDFLKEEGKFTVDDPSAIVGPPGDRIATWIFYLEDVDFGGATVFPTAKARVPVVKGSAVFWYNLNRSGYPDPRTFHAGCPVAIGSKWIANVWFRYVPQIFHKPCLPGDAHKL